MTLSRRYGLVLLALVVVQELWAQQLSDSYYRENPSWIEAEMWASDGEYHLMQLPVVDNPFEGFARYGFSFVDYSFRGEGRSSLVTRLGRVALTEPLERYPDYGVQTLLRVASLGRQSLPSGASSTGGCSLRAEQFDPSLIGAKIPTRLRTQLSTRNYLVGVNYTTLHTLADSTALLLAVGGRMGPDSHIEGFYSSSEQLWLSAHHMWDSSEGILHSLYGAVGVAPSERSQRSWNTEELFSLSGNNLYNSYWGLQEGKVRPSRVVKECVPLLFVAWDAVDPYLLARANVSLLLRGGRRTRSSLDWASAPNPLPDHYTYLPDAQGDPNVALIARNVWLEGDKRYTQVGWDALYHANHLSPDGVHYAMIDERRDQLSAVLDGSLSLEGLEGATIGVRLEAHSSHNYSLAGDLLGGNSLHPSFDLYDYRVASSSWALYGALNRPLRVGYLSVAGELGGERLAYWGHSAERADGFTSGGLRAAWHHETEGVNLATVANLLCSAPYWEELYASSEGAMTPNPYASLHKLANLQLTASGSVEWVALYATLYGRAEWGGGVAESFWNDLSGCYSSLLAQGVPRCGVGVEVSAIARVPSTSLTLEAHASLSTVNYLSDGVADIVDYHSGALTVKGSRLRTRSLGASSSPKLVAALVGRYFTRRGWLLGGEVVAVGGRTLEPSLLFVSDYVQGLRLTPEEEKQLSTPVEMGGACTVSLFVNRRWGPLSATLSVRNLLNSTTPYSGGYQPSRMRVVEREYEISYTPHPAKYRHLYPRHAYLSIAYEF